ncbi:hypothetical protein CONLIGDRAFT_626330 [Coniochaeta ligniaria NRRL 30616]|uniref:Uncharacterized protein n=1 Tax=Coniochaeta ligniaria NRRL 30616 TaxID=1408157 RepID=A0A1J7JW43_9PEZI|nr:hypothetical protein CONLIGDRAFT_626330 [Coniochaeta ligniaria NRRL 30616]
MDTTIYDLVEPRHINIADFLIVIYLSGWLFSMWLWVRAQIKQTAANNAPSLQLEQAPAGNNTQPLQPEQTPAGNSTQSLQLVAANRATGNTELQRNADSARSFIYEPNNSPPLGFRSSATPRWITQRIAY